jgi:hypothetical protein
MDDEERSFVRDGIAFSPRAESFNKIIADDEEGFGFDYTSPDEMPNRVYGV